MFVTVLLVGLTLSQTQQRSFGFGLTNVFTILHQMKLSLEPSLEKLPGLYLVLFQKYAFMCPALHTVAMTVFCIT